MEQAVAQQRASASGSALPVWRGWPVIVAGVALALGAVQAAQRMGAHIPEVAGSDLEATALFYGLLFGPLWVLALGLGWLSRQWPLPMGQQPLRWLAVGTGVGLAGLGLTLGLSALQGGVISGTMLTGTAAAMLAGFGLMVFQVGAEEVMFRGWLQPALAAQVGNWPAVIAASLVFAGFHGTGGPRDMVSLVNIALGGLLFGVLRLRSGGLIAPFAAHFAWNVTESIGLGLVPNPANDVFGSVIDLDLAGPPWWGGQEEGLNASIGTMAVLVAVILPLILARRGADGAVTLTGR